MRGGSEDESRGPRDDNDNQRADGIDDADVEDQAEEELIDDEGDAEEAGDPDADEGSEPASGDEEEGQARRNVGRNRRPSQSERRVIRENRELRERLDRIERDRSQPQQYNDPQAAQREEQAFWESLQYMDEAQRLRAVRDRERGLYVAGLNQVRGETLDAIDRTRFETKAESNPARRRLASEVERHIADLRRAGNFNATRDQVFHLLLGMETDRKANAAAPKQRREARARIERETTRPGNARGDVGREGRSRVDADEAFLRRTRVGDVI